jgi:hypothetical protein
LRVRPRLDEPADSFSDNQDEDGLRAIYAGRLSDDLGVFGVSKRSGGDGIRPAAAGTPASSGCSAPSWNFDGLKDCWQKRLQRRGKRQFSE